MNNNNLVPKLLWLTIFAIAMAFVESAVVVYLRAIFYSDGFKFPLKTITDYKIIIEVFREAATIFILLSITFLAGAKRWERFAYFMLIFGVWDIFYYIWLKVLINWPASIFDWDILFLIPLPWISPVIAPLSISLLMIIFSILISRLIHKGCDFKPTLLSHILALSGTILILYSFMHDVNATLHQQMPKPYHYEFLIIGDGLFITAFLTAYVKRSGNS
jgi:hypothetical protein